MLTRQMHQKNVIFVINVILKILVLNGCHDLIQKATSFNDVAILSIKRM